MKKKKTQNTHKYNKNIFFVILATIILVCLLSFVVPLFFSNEYVRESLSAEVGGVFAAEENLPLIEEKIKPVSHLKTPEELKAIYMTACVASTVSFKSDLVNLIEETELNTIVIDIKDFSGTISYDSGLEGDGGPGCRAKDLPEFVNFLHEKGIYTIARITVFQDPFYANLHPELAVKKESNGTIWQDYKGINFIDVGAKPYWDYIIDLAKKTHQIGFDEINFDYVRFPSDGNMKDIYYPFSEKIISEDSLLGKAKALEEFFKYLDAQISKYNQEQEFPMITSADLFGMVTTNTDDLNIGQVLERALPYFDYVAPMVYPSHYPSHFNGWANPNTVPYELIYFVMSEAVKKVETLKTATSTPEELREKLSKEQLRPWLQDFDYGGNYDVKEVKDQIQGTYDAGLDSWMLWSPSNRYTRGALLDS